MLFCPTCGAKSEDGARFCGNCGTNLEGISGVPEVTGAPSAEAPKEAPEAGESKEGAAGLPWENQGTQPWNEAVQDNSAQTDAVGTEPTQAGLAQAGSGQAEPVQEGQAWGNQEGAAPLRPSQLKKARDQQRADQQIPAGSQITIKKPEINIQRHKGGMKRPSKIQIAVIIEAVCLILVIGIFYGIASSQNDVNSVAKRYFQAYVDKDWSKVYDLTDFPEGAYLQKSQFIEMMENTDVPDITNFEIMADAGVESTGVQRNFLVQYTEKGKSLDNRVLTLMKQGEKVMLFFDTWKVLPTNEVAENFQIFVPKGAAAAVDGAVLSENEKTKTENEGMDCYQVTLFTGTHNIQASMPWHEVYEDEFQATPGGSYTTEALQLTEEGETAIEAKMQEALEKIYQAALEQKKFGEVEDLFIEEYQKNCEESYDYLVSELHDRESYNLKEVKFHDFKNECYADAYQGRIEAEMTYKYDMKYTYTYTSWRSSTPTVEDKTDDGSSYMNASFEYDGETYKIVSFGIRSVL